VREGENVCVLCDLVSVFIYVYFFNCSSRLHILLLSPGASDKFLSLWPFSLYYCVKLMLGINIHRVVVGSKFYLVFAFL